MIEKVIEPKVSFLLSFMYVPAIPFLNYINIGVEKFQILGILVFIDLIFGLLKAYVTKSPIRAKKLTDGVISKVVILVLPLTLGLALVGQRAGSYVDFIVYILIASECYSILENFYVIKTRNNPQKVDVVSFVIKAIQKSLAKWLIDIK